MKKIFPLIIILISLSLIGIIWVQLSWLQSIVENRQEQIKQRVDKVTNEVADELRISKNQFISNMERDILGLNRNLMSPFRRNDIGSIFSTEEIHEKLKKAFDKEHLKDLKFEFGVYSAYRSSGFPILTKQSYNYENEYLDTVNNYVSASYTITSPSGSAAENITPDELLNVVVKDWKKIVYQSLVPNFTLAIVFTLVILAAFYLTVYTMIRQKKLSDIKNDFINNMTHEFKTPIATISLAVDALKNEKVQSSKDKMAYFSGIIKEENQRMNKQVETILKASQFEKQEVELDKKPLHVHDIIESACHNFQLQLMDRGGEVNLELGATNDLVLADEVHFANMINNLIDNAIKYSKSHVPVKVNVKTCSKDKRFILSVQDNGIGMNKETQKRVFEKFYRAHTGNLHNVKGFGLGLSYVKSVAESHNGIVKVESTLGKGSMFILEFPTINA